MISPLQLDDTRLTTPVPNIPQADKRGLKGIRATVPGEQPIKRDAYLLLYIATILLECGLRPDECYRLKWAQSRTKPSLFTTARGDSRRRVSYTQRVTGVLEMRRAESDWVSVAKRRAAML